MQLKLGRKVAVLAVPLLLGRAVCEAQTPGTSSDLPGWSLTPWLRTAGVHEDNTFFIRESKLTALYLRLTPAIEARYRGPLRSLEAAYSFDTELYPDRLKALTDAFVRQQASARIESRLGPRSSLAARASYLATRRPEEVLEHSGLISSRRRTESYDANLTYNRALSPLIGFTADYTFRVLDLGEPSDLRHGSRGTLNTVGGEISFRHSPRSVSAVDYRVQFFVGEESTPVFIATRDFVAHVVTYRWTRHLSPRVTLRLMAGPRVSEAVRLPVVESDVARETAEMGKPFRTTQELQPEILASLSYRATKTQFAVAYARSQFDAFGLLGWVNTESLELRAIYQPNPKLRIDARPGAFRNSQGLSEATSYRAYVSARLQLGRWMSLDGGWLYQYQNEFLLSEAEPLVRRQQRERTTVSFGVTIRRSMRLD